MEQTAKAVDGLRAAVERKYLKTATESVGLQDARASVAWLTLSMRRGVRIVIEHTVTNVAVPNKPRCIKLHKRIGPSLPSVLTRSGACLRVS